MNRIAKHCIIIDDNDQSLVMNKLVADLRTDNVELTYKQINPKDFLEVDSVEGTSFFDKEKMDDAIKKEFKNGATMIACDNGLGDTVDFEGYDLIQKIRHEMKYKYELILYSANLNTILTKIFDSDDKINSASRLVKCNIKEFLNRDTYTESLKGYLKKSSFDIQQELLHWLHTFENHKFQGHPLLERKTLGKIADAIENDETLGIEFQKLFVEQGVSMMIKLNNLPDYE